MTTAEADARATAGMAAELARLQRRVESLELGANTTQLGQSSIEDGSMVVYDANGNPRAIIGKQEDGSYVGGRVVNNPTPPIIPAAPTVVPGFGTLKVETHGPSTGRWMWDYSHTNVWLAKGIPGGEGPVEEGVVVGNVIGLNPSMLVISGLEAKPYRIWLSSVNMSGTESDYSEPVTATPTSVVGADILEGAIGELQLATDAVTQAKIAAGAVGSIQIGEQVIDLAHLAANSVGGEQLIAGAIAAGHLGAGSVTALAIAAQAIQAINIAAEAISAEHLTAGAVTAEKILALAITAEKIAVNSVTAGAIAAGAITADKIRAGEVLADVSVQTGSSGRRILLSGPDNEIRFFPSLGETKYARVFSYQPLDFPDDVNLEIRAINSVQTNVTPRLVMSPDDAFLGLTDAANDATPRGGRVRLAEDSAHFGITTQAGAEIGLFSWDDGLLQLRGFWENYTFPYANTAVWVMNISVVNNSAAAITGVSMDYGITMASAMAPVMSCGLVDSNNPMYSIRDETNTLTGFGVRFGLNNNGASPAAVGQTPALPTGGKVIKIRCWAFRTLTEISMPLT